MKYIIDGFIVEADSEEEAKAFLDKKLEEYKNLERL